MRASGHVRLGACAALLSLCAGAFASGPRFVAGPPFFSAAAGTAVRWKQANLTYFTDPGDLSAAVPHAAADALVAAAAGVWNIPVASITVSQGGQLAEHVSGANVYLSADGMVWPDDVASANAAAIPISVVYDSDGSVTETLLGAGAGDPAQCQQNAVTETVDLFDPAGYISHAIVVLNGRCTGTAPEQQLQMQYQLERVFGRVLGLAWSQTNDNVFTGTPQPTYDQALNWPIMHPLDILCGLYSYQCLPKPFTLRPDDIAGMVGLYPIPNGSTPPPGKQLSFADANSLEGFATFPTGEGMAGVNILIQQAPRFASTPQGWFQTSAVTGSSFRRTGASPFTTAVGGPAGSMGSTNAYYQGFYFVPWMAVTDPYNAQTEIVSTEPINPLYIGDASVGPYAPGIVSPAGSAPTPYTWLGIGPGGRISQTFAIADAPSSCGAGTDGTAAEPVAAAASGWWNGLLCGYGHAAFSAVPVKGGRSLTVEVTALDANGLATTAKAMPVIGLFAPTDAPSALPSLGLAASAFNGLGVGTTTLAAQPFASGDPAGGVVRLGIADQRGDGRPDFPYQARVFYADNLAPATVGTAGGTVTLTGMGFRNGNEVLVNGVPATVASWTANTIVFTAPSLAAANATAGTAVDVEVLDLGTGATSTVSGALTYDAGALPNQMLLVSAPSGTVPVAAPAPTAFTVQVVAPDGVTPVVGDTVVFSATAGSAKFGACNAATCSVATDANGNASSTVTPSAAGAITVQAVDGSLSQSATFLAAVQPASMNIVKAPAGNVGVGQTAGTPFEVQVLAADGKTGLAGQLVTFTVPAGAANYGGCNASPCSAVTNSSGLASVSVTPTAAGTVTLQAADGPVSQQASFTAVADSDILTVVHVPSSPAYVGENAGNFYGLLTKSDGVTPVTYVPVVLTAPTGIQYYACGSNTCVSDTQYNGVAGTSVVPLAAGTYTLRMAYGSLVATTTLTATVRQPSLAVVSAPSGQVLVGAAAAVPFAVQALDRYGNPAPGQMLSIGGDQNQVASAPCGMGNCYVATDGNGIASVAITPLAAGPVTLTATWLNLNAAASFTAVGGVETLNVATAPPASVAVGANVPFALQVLAPDGVTPVPNVVVWVLVGSGSFAIDGCSSGQCKYWTDAKGMVSLTGVGTAPGTVSLLANGETGSGMTQTMTFVVTAKPALAALEPQTYLAAGATATLALEAAATQSGGPAAGVAVAWKGATGFAVSAGTSTTNAAGDAAAQAAVGPLAAGAQAAAKACAWTSVCALFNASGVAASALQIAIASGGQQAATGGAALNPVTAQVTDGLGHPVLGASVTVGQTARAYDAPCPATGRCPAAPVLASSNATLVSDANGMVSIAPLAVPGTATSTSLAFSTGTQGFATAVVTSTP